MSNNRVGPDAEQPQTKTTTQHVVAGKAKTTKLEQESPYAKRKDYAQGLLDAALFLSNTTQLRTLMKTEAENRDNLWTVVTTFVLLSMILQVIVGVLLLQLQVLNPDDADDAERYGCCYKDENKKRKFRWTLDRINNLTLCLIFFILLCNTVISGVGVDFFGALPGSTNETK